MGDQIWRKISGVRMIFVKERHGLKPKKKLKRNGPKLFFLYPLKHHYNVILYCMFDFTKNSVERESSERRFSRKNIIYNDWDFRSQLPASLQFSCSAEN